MTITCPGLPVKLKLDEKDAKGLAGHSEEE